MRRRTGVSWATIAVVITVVSTIIGLFTLRLSLSPPSSVPSQPPSSSVLPPLVQPLDQPLPGEEVTHRAVLSIDKILEKLDFGNIAFNTPKVINLEDTAIIQLVLSLKKSTEELIQTIKAAGEKEGARIQVSNRMEARLSGPNFAITAITPEIQAVSQTAITEWKWEIKPSSVGHYHLHLTLCVLLSVDNSSTPRALRTFDKEIEVEVTGYQRVGLLFKEYWQWLWTALLVPIAGWLWKRKKESKTEHD